MNPAILTEPDLLEITGTRQRAALRRKLEAWAVPYRVGNNGVITTLEALNKALGVQEEPETIEILEV